jgi:ankyrin repeat protein
MWRVRRYNYAFEDDHQIFQSVISFLNGESIRITPETIEAFRNVAADLQLECLAQEAERSHNSFETNQEKLTLEFDALERYSTLQNLLCDLDPSNIDESCAIFLASPWVADSESMKEFAANFIAVAAARPRMGSILAIFVKVMHEALGERSFLDFLNRRVLALVVNGHISSFAFKLCELTLLSFEAVAHRFFLETTETSKRLSIHSQRKWQLYLGDGQAKFTGFPDLASLPASFLWFLPEIEEHYPLLARAYVRQATNVIPRPARVDLFERGLSQAPFPFAWLLRELRANRWKLLRELRLSQQNPHPLALAISEDSVEALQNALIQLGATVSTSIPACPFENGTNLTLLGYAASRRSLRIVRHLLVNGAVVGPSEMKAAVESGDTEIVRLLDEKYVPGPKQPPPHANPHLHAFGPTTVPPPTFLGAAISSYRNEIFHWLVDAKLRFDSISTYELTSVVTSVFRTNNFDGLMTLVNLGLDLRSLIGGSNPTSIGLRSVVQLGSATMLRVISALIPDAVADEFRASMGYAAVKRSRTFAASTSNSPITTEAASTGSLAILDLIASHLGDLPPDSIVTALSLALANGHSDVVAFLLAQGDRSALSGHIATILQNAATLAPASLAAVFLAELPPHADLLPALDQAVHSRNIALAQLLLEAQLRQNPRAPLDRILRRAIQAGDLTIPRRIVEVIERFTIVEEAIEDAIRIGFADGVRWLLSIVEDRAAIVARVVPTAIACKESEILSILLGVDLGSPAALVRAVRSGSPELVRGLLERESSAEAVNRVTEQGTALAAAAEIGNVEIAEMLLAVPGIRPGRCDCQQQTPLMIAARFKHIGVMRAIVRHYGDRIREEEVQLERAFLPESIAQGDTEVDFRAGDDKGWILPRMQDLTFELVPFFLEMPYFDVRAHFAVPTILLVAARTRNLHLLKAVCEVQGIDMNVTDSRRDTPFIICVVARFMAGLQLLGDLAVVNINHRNRIGETALTVAAGVNRVEMVRYLIGHPRFDAEKSNATRAFIEAVALHAADTPALILALDFDINRTESVTLWKHDRDIPLRPTYCRTTPLVATVRYGTGGMVNQILTHPRFVASKNGITRALFAAVKGNDLVSFQALLALGGGKVNVHNARNESLFVYCCLRGSIPILQALMQADSFHPSARELQKAAAVVRADQGGFVPILSRIANLDWNLRFLPDANGERLTSYPLRIYGAHLGLPPERNGFPDIPAGSTPLIAALRYHKEHVLHALYAEPGIDRAIRGEYGQTCLWELGGLSASFSQLMEQFTAVDLNAQDMHGNTAAMFAVIAGHRDSLTVLVRRGADLDVRNYRGETLWELAHARRGVEPPPPPHDPDVFLRRVLALMACPAFTAGSRV